MKRHKEYTFNKKIPQWSCLCEMSENALSLVNCFNKKFYPESRLPATINELLVRFSCEDVEKYMLLEELAEVLYAFLCKLSLTSDLVP